MRRIRCAMHDTLHDGQCPSCRVAALEMEVEKYKKALALWGDPVRVHVSYTWRDVFQKVLRAFTYPGTNWQSPGVLVGKGASSETSGNPMPRAVAEKLAEAAKDMDAEYRTAMKAGYEDGVSLVTRIASEALTDEFVEKLAAALLAAAPEFNKEQQYSLSSALEKAVKERMTK